MRHFKSILVVLVAALFLAGCYHQGAQPQTTDTTETVIEEGAMMENGVVIAYIDDGFDPQTVTVQVGTTVTFVNQSSTEMWVASAVHPTHQELPGFDQLGGGAAGSRYSFTFEESGTWRFHDHLNPTAFGSVVVE